MFSVKIKLLFFGCFVLITNQCAVVESSILPIDLSLTDNERNISLTNTVSSLGNIVGGVVSDTTSILQDSVTKALCNLRTDELITYYGYLAEVHYVLTEDGYNLTMFRCNSNKTVSGIKKAVILQHGFLSSSDDFCINIPSQALAYIMADEGYDVFLPNARGNFYSKNHINLSPDDSRFWNFSWTEIGIFDYPAVYNYVIELTGNEKVYVVGHSQGTSAMMAALSERLEVNDLVHAVSLLAPVGYLNSSGPIYQFAGQFLLPLEALFEDTEFLPRGIGNDLSGTVCSLGLEGLCNSLLFVFLGPNYDQTNDTMIPAFLCHLPSGASFRQIIHYGMEIRYGYFGDYKHGSKIPSDFNLSQITAPISLHFSPDDPLTNPIDVHRLIPQLNSLAFVQEVIETKFNHMDFVYGKNTAKIVYRLILDFFNKYQ